MALHISSTAFESIEESALASMPEECCGLLIGRIDGSKRLVERTQTAINIAAGDRHKRYEIDPQAVFDAIRKSNESGEQLLGFFHSHPDSSLQPSSHDVKTAWPDKSYLIVGVNSSGIVGHSSWRLGGGGKGMQEEPITLTDRQLLH